jgi:signal transduction histidine kinase
MLTYGVKGLDERQGFAREQRGDAIADGLISGVSAERLIRLAADTLADSFEQDRIAGIHEFCEALAGHMSVDTLRLATAAEIFVAFAEALARDRPALEGLAEALQAEEGVSREALAVAVLRSSRLARLPVGVAGQVILSLVVGLLGVRGASVWRLAGGVPERVVAADEDVVEPTSVVALARKVLDRGARQLVRDDAVVVAINSDGGDAVTALATWGPPAGSAVAVASLHAAAATLATALDCASSAARASVASDDAAATTQRRLTRLRFDLHDGPQQDVLLLAEDLRLFGSQLGGVVKGHPDRDRLLGRLEDLEARLVALDGDLRRISSSLHSPFLQPGSLPDAVADLTSAFSERTGVVPNLEITGDMSRLTDSQHITLLGVLREALSNVREHSEATSVVIRITAGDEGVTACVEDDGRGFDPETSLLQAARGGHLGLVGMHERVRMLGGHTHIDSHPGGPTVISVQLPAAPATAPRRV